MTHLTHPKMQCPGFVSYQELETVLMSDQMTQVMRKYPELASDSEGGSLQTELDMFLTLPAINNECPNLGRPTCSQALYSMVPTTHAMFPYVEALCSLNRQSGSCSGAHSRLVQLFAYDATGFFTMFLIIVFKFGSFQLYLQMPKCGARRMYPHFQKRGAALDVTYLSFTL